MLVSEFHYDLPQERIAQEPLADRAASRLLHLHRTAAATEAEGLAETLAEPRAELWKDRLFQEFPDLLRPDDLLVINNTRVFPARLYGHRSGERAQPLSSRNPAARQFLRGQVEVLLTRQVSREPNLWECLVRPGRKIGIGEKLFFGDAQAAKPELQAEVIARGSFGQRVIRFISVGEVQPDSGADFFTRLERIGHVPLPPYIDRQDRPADRDRYQTVYASRRGSVAAPTAGLHFTPGIFERIRARGIEIAEITLHVGLGTFQPIRTEKVEDHTLHREWFEISSEAAKAINQAKSSRRRLVAVGTTTVRTLEYAAQQAGEHRVAPGRSEADIFIYPGYTFRMVDALLTNFHLPQSSLLMLVCAFGGTDLMLRAYGHAVEAGYRFYSYGDCMFVE